MLAKLAYRIHHRRKLVGAVSLAFVLVAGAWAANVQSKMSVARGDFDSPHTQSVLAQQELQRVSGASPEPDFVALIRDPRGIATPAGRAQVDRVAAIVSSHRVVARIATPFARVSPLRTPISRDGNVTFVAAYFKSIDGTVAQKDANLAELLGIPVLFLLTFLFFRGGVAAALPLVIAGVSIVGTLAVLRTITEFTRVSFFAVNLVTALGTALAIDYSLFIVNRYREELAAGGERKEVLARTLSSAGRTVAFSSGIVTLACLSLLVFPQQTIRSMGAGGLVVAAISGIAALTVLPAVLDTLGDRVNSMAPARLQRAARRSAKPDESGPWYRLAAFVMRRPVLVALTAGALLLALGTPTLRVAFGRPDARVLPAHASARRVSDEMNAVFGANASAPIFVAVHAPPNATPQVLSLARSARRLPGVEAVQQPLRVAPGLWQLNVISRGDAVSSAAQSAVRGLRSMSSPVLQLKVGGEPARYIDQQASIGQKLPTALTILVGTSLVMLLLMTGSVVLPIKALVMNLLTLSATCGVLVWVFQDGHLQKALGFTSGGSLEPETMVLLFFLAYALATDYGVFLLTRIKEAWDGGMSNSDAVAHGLERTGRIVTAAALLMCVALGTLMVSRIEYIKELGLGAACAILVDAMIVRPFLVPSLMKLLGRWNWWGPPRLRAVGERVAIETPVARR